MKVILIGYRACGKSTIGRLLAGRIKIPFWDADLLLEEGSGMPIKDIVANHGWDYFRAREKETIEKLADKGACVIATGGGAILARENVEMLKNMGVIVWLNAPLQDIIDRLQEDAKDDASRPPFTNSNIVQETIDVLKQRLPLYQEAADFMTDTSGKSAPQVMEIIYQYLLESGNLAKINKSRNRAGHLPAAILKE
jgi:shikimate kinase